MNRVIYQKNQPDQFMHRYYYDGDNRITRAQSSANGFHWDNDAKYEYYLHGPLKRNELGELKVQGLDYVYTLHGWIKGVNSTTLQADRDPGRDGFGGVNQYVANDVFGYSLSYYEGDYKAIGQDRIMAPISTAQLFTPTTLGTTLGTASPNLYNGNIRHMVTAIKPFMSNGMPQARAYHYDQLNRIKDAYTYNQVNLGSNSWGGFAPVADYEEHFSYDANGNIMTLQRHGTTAGGRPLLMDNFTYNYQAGTNKLTHVNDVVAAGNYTDDIDNQATNNYEYDAIGNLTKDNAEQIASIEWTVYGKIKKITRTVGSTKPNLEYEYSPDGHRVSKKVTMPNGNINFTYYLRDAQGNTMSTYTFDMDTFRWTEAHIYGSSRIGVYLANKDLVIGGVTQTSTLANNEKVNTRGKRNYELSNHLGNVLVVISDKRQGVCTGQNVISYEAEIVSATDYYAFGSAMPGREYTMTDYKYGFNGKELDKNEEGMGGGGSTYDYGFRIYNPNLGKFLSVDPLTASYPWYTPYQFAGNKPIQCVDLDGLEEINVTLTSPPSNFVVNATITINMTYMQVTSGNGAIHGIDAKKFNEKYNQGNQTIIYAQLPGPNTEPIELYGTDLELAKEAIEGNKRAIRKLKRAGYKNIYVAQIQFNYNIIQSPNTTLDAALTWMNENKQGRGIILEQIPCDLMENIPNDNLKKFMNEAHEEFLEPYCGGYGSGQTMGFIDNFIAIPKFTLNNTNLTDRVVHEAGHNSAANHYHLGGNGHYEYHQQGLQNGGYDPKTLEFNDGKDIYPSKENIESILKDAANRGLQSTQMILIIK